MKALCEFWAQKLQSSTFIFLKFVYSTVPTKSHLLPYEQWKVLLCISSFLRRIEMKQWQREIRPHFRYIFHTEILLDAGACFFFFNRHFKYYTSNFILLTSENLGNAEMKKVKCIHNLITRETVSMGKPHHIQLETLPHLELRISSGENTTPSLPPSLYFPISFNPTLFQNELQAAAWQSLNPSN